MAALDHLAGLELAVRLDDRTRVDPEVARQGSNRRQLRARLKGSLGDVVGHLGHQLAVGGRGGPGVELVVQHGEHCMESPIQLPRARTSNWFRRP